MKDSLSMEHEVITGAAKAEARIKQLVENWNEEVCVVDRLFFDGPYRATNNLDTIEAAETTTAAWASGDDEELIFEIRIS